MRIAIATICLIICAGAASAQTQPQAQAQPKAATDSPDSTGRTVLPPAMDAEKDKTDGRASPNDTGSGGAPAESPQGQTPPSMQAAPDGSSKTIVDPK
jgi:hypothetical protein